MSWVTVIFSMVAAASGTLGLVQLMAWWQNRARRDVLAFSVLALSSAGLALGELAMMEAKTPAAFNAILRWLHLPAWVAFVAHHTASFSCTCGRGGFGWPGWWSGCARSRLR